MADFSGKTMQPSKQYRNIFEVKGEKNCHPRILYPVKSSFRKGGKIKTFRYTKAKSISLWQTCIIRNVKRSPSSRH